MANNRNNTPMVYPNITDITIKVKNTSKNFEKEAIRHEREIRDDDDNDREDNEDQLKDEAAAVVAKDQP